MLWMLDSSTGLWPSLWLAPLLWVVYSTQFHQSSLSWMVLLLSLRWGAPRPWMLFYPRSVAESKARFTFLGGMFHPPTSVQLCWMVLLISLSCTRADALDGNSSTGSRSSLWLVSSLSGWPVPPLLPIQTSWMVLLPGSHTGARFGHRPSSRWNQPGPVQLPAQQPKLQYLQQRHTPLTSGVVVMGSALLDEGFPRLFNMVCPSWA